MNQKPFLAIFLIIAAMILGSMAASAPSLVAFDLGPAAPPDPDKVVGNDACVKCHASEQAVWEATPHAKTFDELHRRPEARKIAENLGLSSIKHSDRCTGCHYTPQSSQASRLTATASSDTPAGAGPDAAHRHFAIIAGVSCESCHGPARDWLELHHDYGGEHVTRQTESPEHRRQRIARSIEAGMRNPQNVYLIAQSCYRCHWTADEELVNLGGHSPGSPDFEFVSWSQGMIHHNFVESDGKHNRPSSPERLRVMFAAGVIADVEAGLRAVAEATEKKTYGIQAAGRTARAAARLKSLAEKVGDPRLARAVEAVEAVQLKLNNREPLLAAADELARLGRDFAETPPTEALEAIDRFILDRSKWK